MTRFRRDARRVSGLDLGLLLLCFAAPGCIIQSPTPSDEGSSNSDADDDEESETGGDEAEEASASSGADGGSTSGASTSTSGGSTSGMGSSGTTTSPGTSTSTTSFGDTSTSSDTTTSGETSTTADEEGSGDEVVEATSDTGETPGGSPLADEYPCDGSTDGYDAVVTGSGSSWSVNGQGYGSLFDALRAAMGSGGISPSDMRTVLLQDSGDVPANAQVRIPSNTVFNACGTINVVPPTGGSDQSPCYARGASNIVIPHITITGAAQYGCFFRDVDDIQIGIADIRLEGGLGMRFDNNPAGNNWGNSTSNAARRSGVRIDEVYVEGTSMGVEFYGIEDITIGTVVARNTSEAGLMLNNSFNVDVDLVDGRFVSPNAGYAVFRMANDNGKDWDSGTHPMNIHVRKVIARESGGSNGRGIFCVTDSGGVTIDEVDLESTASTSIWLEWCTNVRIGNPTTPSRIHDSGEALISYGTDTRRSNDLVFENIAITQTNISFNHDCPPNIDWIDVTRDGVPVTTCE